MRRIFFASLCLLLSSNANAFAGPPRLKVSENKRYLTTEDGKPFFYLADTAWEMFHRLDRQEAALYLKDRAAKRFTVIQAVVLAELDGLDTPNSLGEKPLIDHDPTKPNEKYFEHVDYMVNEAEKLDLFVGMLPTWGTWWHDDGRTIFTVENARAYGEFLGKRYKDKPIIWILGGDRAPENDRHKAIIRAMAEGIRRGDGGVHLMTFHPPGGRSSAQWFHADPWLDFNMRQTGHDYNRANYDMIAEDYRRTPTKPCVDGEPGYEDHPAGFNPKNGYMNEDDVRKFAYWAVFAGAAGHTYGCHDIWQMYRPGREPISSARTPWKEALNLPGSGQMKHLRALMESRAFLTRVPDRSLLVGEPLIGGDHLQATRDEKGSYALIYSASGKPFTVDTTKLTGERFVASWFDPRNGETREFERFDRSDRREFRPPTSGKGRDWILILDVEKSAGRSVKSTRRAEASRSPLEVVRRGGGTR